MPKKETKKTQTNKTEDKMNFINTESEINEIYSKEDTVSNNNNMMNQLSEQIEYLEEYNRKLIKSLEELNNLKSSLLELNDVKEGDEIYAPVANGIFVQAKIKNPKELLVNVGEGVVLKKSIPETIKLLEKQEKEINEAKQEVENKISEIYSMFAH